MSSRAEKRKLRKKLQRQRKRQKLAQERDEEPADTTDNNEDEKTLHAPTTFGTGSMLTQIREEAKEKSTKAAAEKSEETPKTTEPVTPKNTNSQITAQATSKTYGAWYGNVGDLKQRPKRQRRGLRCKKCFVLLARDDDFDYKNGQLWINTRKVPKSWDGYRTKNSIVFCQNMHNVGRTKQSTFANTTIYVPVLNINKTTFKANFMDNHKFAGSDKIKNKLNYNETKSTDWLKVYLPPKEFLPEFSKDAVPDRYHQKVSNKAEGVNNWRTGLDDDDKGS